VVDSNGLPVRLALCPGEAHDVRLAGKLRSGLKSGSMLLADRGYDADWIRELATKRAHGPTSRRKAIAAIRLASVRTSIALAARSNDSSTGSNNVVVWRRATIGLRETTLPSFNLHLSGYGWPRVMSPRAGSRRRALGVPGMTHIPETHLPFG
jgi:transposase